MLLERRALSLFSKV